MTIGTASAGPGEKSFGRVPVTQTTGLFDVYIPVTLINGVKEGPKLLVTAAMHGNEIFGTIALVKLAQRLDPKKLKGTLLCVPAVNISAFERQERAGFWDGTVLNWVRTQPRKEGSVSEQVWYTYQNEIVSKADYHLDFHSGSMNYVHYTSYRMPSPEDDPDVDPDVFKRMRDMALAFGVDQVLSKIPTTWGEVTNLPMKKPFTKPHILVEIGGGNLFRGDEYVETNIRGITNVMKYLGMLEGKIEPQSEVAHIYDASYGASSTRGGLFDRKVNHGDAVKKGQAVIEVLHPYTGELLEQVRAPVDGVVINTGTLFKAGPRASMVFGKLVETVNLREYFKG